MRALREGAARWRLLTAVLALLLAASVLQAWLDRTPAGSGGSDAFPSAASLTRFLGGLRQ